MKIDEETVIDETLDPSEGNPVPAKGQERPLDQPVDPKEFRALQKRAEEQDRRIAELTDSERYWSERARGGAAAKPDEEDEPDPDDNVIEDSKPEDLVDALTAKGFQALKDRGVITKREMRELVQKEVEKHGRKVAEEVVARERGKMTTDAEIASKYPDLKNPESPLFQKTRDIYREMVKHDPEKANDPGALLDAAERAKLHLEIEDLRGGRGRRDDDDPGERIRQERIRAQAPERGRRTSEFETDDSRLSDTARDVIRQMGVSEDDFLEARRGGRRGR